jgi:hypothetical protein
MVVAEVLTGIALVKQATDFIKSNLDTVNDIKQIGDQIEDLFVGEEQCQRERARKSSMGVGDQFGIKNVAQEVIDAKLAQEKMQEMRVMIDNRFGAGTWQSIVDLRAKRIREAREAAEKARKEKIKKQKEFEEAIMRGLAIMVVVGTMIGAFVYIFISATT